MKRVLWLAALIAGPALAQDDPRFCPNRPDLGASTCTVRPGQVLAEVSAIDWERDDTAATRTDTVATGDLLVRFGVGPRTEVQVGWTAFTQVRERDKPTGLVDRTSGVGDVRLGLRQNLRNVEGDGLSLAAEPFVTLPVGGRQVGAGDWGAGVVLPISYALGQDMDVALTGTAEALPDEDGRGRHLSLEAIAGLGFPLGDQVSAVAELSVRRDHDPAGHRTLALAAGSVAWQPARHWQLDLLVAAGLNRDTPDVRVAIGGAVLFK